MTILPPLHLYRLRSRALSKAHQKRAKTKRIRDLETLQVHPHLGVEGKHQAEKRKLLAKHLRRVVCPGYQLERMDRGIERRRIKHSRRLLLDSEKVWR